MSSNDRQQTPPGSLHGSGKDEAIYYTHCDGHVIRTGNVGERIWSDTIVEVDE